MTDWNVQALVEAIDEMGGDEIHARWKSAGAQLVTIVFRITGECLSRDEANDRLREDMFGEIIDYKPVKTMAGWQITLTCYV